MLSFATMATVVLAADGSGTVRHPWERVLAAAAGAGFRGVALDWFTLRAAERAGAAVETLAERARDHGLVFTDLSAIGLGADANTDLGVASAMARRCAALGIPVCALVVSVPPGPSVLDRIARCADTFAANGVRLALEFVPYTAVRSLAEARALCEQVGFERCGLLVDTWHLTRSGGSPADLACLDRHEIACVQVADVAPEPIGDLALESRQRRRLPGDGVVDFAAFAVALARVGYDGPIGTEVLSGALSAGSPDVVARACFRAARPYFGA